MLTIEEKMKFAEWCRTVIQEKESAVAAVALRGEDTKPLLKDAATLKRTILLLMGMGG